MLQLAVQKVMSSGLTQAQAQALGMYSIDNALTFGSNFSAAPALVIPYHDVFGKPLLDATSQFFRLRYLDDPKVKSFVDKKQRYSQPARSGVHAYFPKNLPWASIVDNVDEPIFITEGELKAAKAALHLLSTIGLGGVHNFRASKEGIFWLKELEEVKWAKRSVYIVYDSDYTENPLVCQAINTLGEELQERGAFTKLVTLPDLLTNKKTGLDDYLLARSEEQFMELVEEAEPLTMARALWNINDSIVYVKNPGLIIDIPGQYKMAVPAFTSHSDWATESVPQRIVKPGGHISVEKANAAAVWIKWPLRRSVNRITYAPGEPRFTEDGCYNQWEGWGCEPIKGDIKPWTDLLKFLFEGADTGFMDWFLDWCAYPLQHPGTKLFSAVIVHGRATGTGKTLVGYILGDIYGSNFTKVTNKQLKSQFNSWAADKQFILGDEISGTDKRAESDELKAVITQEEISINIKMLPEYTIPDCINYYFTSNHADAFYIEDMDRRYAIHEVVQDAPLPDEFYQGVASWRANGGPGHLFHALLERNLRGFNPAAPAFKTAARARMVVHSRSDLGSWCADLRECPEVFLTFGKLKHQRDIFTSRDILGMYQQNHDAAGKVTVNGMSRALSAAGFTQAYKGMPLNINGTQSRYFIIRNTEKWKKASTKDMIKNIGLPPL